MIFLGLAVGKADVSMGRGFSDEDLAESCPTHRAVFVELEKRSAF